MADPIPPTPAPPTPSQTTGSTPPSPPQALGATPPPPPQAPASSPTSQTTDGLTHETATPAGHDATSPQSPPVNPPTNPGATQPMGTAMSGAVLPDDLAAQWRRTKCLNCGFVHEGTEMMKKCPRCGNSEPDKFEEVD